MNFKKLSSIILLSSSLLSLTACGNTNKKESASKNNEPKTEETQPSKGSSEEKSAPEVDVTVDKTPIYSMDKSCIGLKVTIKNNSDTPVALSGAASNNNDKINIDELLYVSQTENKQSKELTPICSVKDDTKELSGIQDYGSDKAVDSDLTKGGKATIIVEYEVKSKDAPITVMNLMTGKETKLDLKSASENIEKQNSKIDVTINPSSAHVEDDTLAFTATIKNNSDKDFPLKNTIDNSGVTADNILSAAQSTENTNKDLRVDITSDESTAIKPGGTLTVNYNIDLEEVQGTVTITNQLNGKETKINLNNLPK